MEPGWSETQKKKMAKAKVPSPGWYRARPNQQGWNETQKKDKGKEKAWGVDQTGTQEKG